jgi:hypothetical protein
VPEHEEVDIQVPLPEGVVHEEELPPTQQVRSDGPVQYPDTEVPEQVDDCLQVPLPEGVEQALLVQHFTSSDPGQRPEVTDPEQHPAEMLTHTPSTPETEQVAEYEHNPREEFPA